MKQRKASMIKALEGAKALNTAVAQKVQTLKDFQQDTSFIRAILITRSIKHDVAGIVDRLSRLESFLDRAEANFSSSHIANPEAEARRDYFLAAMEREEADLSKKRQYHKRPGLKEAAKQLGCTYEHLRFVLLGVRKSRSLLARYAQLNASQPSTLNPQPSTLNSLK